MKSAPAVVSVAFVLALLTWLLLNGLNVNSARYDSQLEALGDFTRFERGMTREVLTARAGLSRNYDALVQMVNAYDDALTRLRDTAGLDVEQARAIDVLSARADRQESLIERFKSRNALLQNSFAYFGLFSDKLAESDSRPLVTAASALAAGMLRLTLDTSDAAARQVEDRLEELAQLQAPAAEKDSVRALLTHGQMLHDLLPDIDTILKALVADSNNREQDAMLAVILKRQHAARASARKTRLLQYITSLLLLSGIIYFGMLLRKRAMALRRRAAFEHVIANISMLFINSNSERIAADVEMALHELAGCIGADRAYFACVAGTTVHTYRWSREGIEFEQGWPERALDFAQRFDGREDGIVYIPQVSCPHPNDTMSLLAEAGVSGWLCIMAASGSRDGILGFDAVHGDALTYWSEVSLFRMAFDAIGNAIRRARLEGEKERLQASLQQARRMETIGTFASGIAHNFNNIVGAILGYAEMADARIPSGSRPAASLAEIRRAGERARELVEQILSFGRRGEGRRERVCVKTLIDETRSLLAASLPSHVRLEVSETAEASVVTGEPAQLQQVILNLCNNAAQAMKEPGRIELRIKTCDLARPLPVGRSEVGPGRFIVISVTDPGPGMDEATLERIFEPFFTTRSEGNGLGLATVREIVEQHGGAVAVRSRPDAGTRFDVWLPSGEPDEPQLPSHGSDPALLGAGETVLVIDTDRRRLLRYEEILAALGYEPVGFTRLAEAIAACRAAHARFDAALVCHLPGGSSLDVAAALHDAAPDLPIILAAPSTRDLAMPSLETSGITELVHHPLVSAELAGVLARSLASSATGGRSRRIAGVS
ncbi:two-component system VirA-like sensor kinase [Bradyrhizobium liaoningense]|uniref:two-component system VirA-like sensor kinase n=1 Tax=Bradyrhizobium liaoningense TaxID=43992 RepID=UPI001BAD20DF|nr:two-component system VirA-like sensor kinase [Bradyrhizobium liaoningense]MBR0709833.1 two-component system VirA-like sensor kinase [Bradyrhizobium liaoningense]